MIHINQYLHILCIHSFCTLRACHLPDQLLALCKCRLFCSLCLFWRCRTSNTVFRSLPFSICQSNLHLRTFIEASSHTATLKFPFCCKTSHKYSESSDDVFEIFSNSSRFSFGHPWERARRPSSVEQTRLKRVRCFRIPQALFLFLEFLF